MSITKISKKISLIFALTLLAAAMLPMTVFAKEKLPNPTNLKLAYDYTDENGRIVGENDNWTGQIVSLFWDVSSYYDGEGGKLTAIRKELQTTVNTYEDGILVDSYTSDKGKDYLISGLGIGYNIAKRDYAGHKYTFGVVVKDTSGQYDNSDEVFSGVLDNGLVDKYKAYMEEKYPGIFDNNSSSSDSSTPSSDSNSTPAADNSAPAPESNSSAGTSTVSDWNGINDLMGKLQEAAAKGGNQSVTYYGNFALPYEVMKFLQDNPKVTLYYNVYYAEEGKTYNTKIGGKKVVADQNIPWYGPLYLASIYGTTQSASAPVTVGDGEYLIQDGDTLSSIAASLNVSVSHLVSANNIENPDLIIAGKILKY